MHSMCSDTLLHDKIQGKGSVEKIYHLYNQKQNIPSPHSHAPQLDGLLHFCEVRCASLIDLDTIVSYYIHAKVEEIDMKRKKRRRKLKW